MNTIWVPNNLGRDQARHFVWPADIGPNSLQLGHSADHINSKRIIKDRLCQVPAFLTGTMYSME